MDWKRVKTLFIALLILLNLFLAGTLAYGNAAGSSIQEYNTHAAGILAVRGISLAGDWPKGQPAAGTIRFDNGSPPINPLVERLMPGASIETDANGRRQYRMGTRILTEASGAESGNTVTTYEDVSAGYQLDVASDDKRDREIRALLNGIGLGAYQLVFENALETEEGTRLIYAQSYKKGKVFDNQVVLLLRGSGVARMVLSLHPIRQLIAPADGGAGEVLTAMQAVLLSPLQGPMAIGQIEYGWSQADLGELYFSPVWQLRLVNGQGLRLDAYTGALLPK